MRCVHPLLELLVPSFICIFFFLQGSFLPLNLLLLHSHDASLAYSWYAENKQTKKTKTTKNVPNAPSDCIEMNMEKLAGLFGNTDEQARALDISILTANVVVTYED